MKKLLLIFIALAMSFSIVACGSHKEFVELGADKVLVIGNTGERFMNHISENETVSTLTYALSVTHTLHRSSYSYSTNGSYVQHDGYYYYWDTETQYETEELGKKTTKNTFTYSYLPYGDDENIAVKTTVLTEVSYDYSGGWIEKNVNVSTDLNGYFSSFAILKAACPELAEMIDVSTTRKYYVDVTTPKSIYNDETYYNTYYYIEKI